MHINLEQWIANIQAKPEPIRVRYLLGCMACSMILILGVWALSVSQGFQTVSQDAQNAKDSTKNLLPKTSNFSLDSILSGEKSLEERKKEVSGEMFIQQQMEEKKQNPNQGTFTPPPEGGTPASDTTMFPSMTSPTR